LAGIEIETTHLIPVGSIVDASINARLGFILRDRVLFYGEAGIGTDAVGGFGGYTTGFALWEGGVQVGYNVGLGNFVIGAEVETYYPITGSSIVGANLNARLGATLGNLLAYGEAGVGTYIGAPIWTAGGGCHG